MGAIRQKALPKMPLPRTIAVTSGKGGVGKTNLAANLAIALCKLGKRTLLVDVDLGLANIDVLLNLRPRFNLHHVLLGQMPVREILIDGPEGVQIVPASSGIEEMANLTPWQHRQLVESFADLDEQFDIAVIDTGAGMSSNVMNFVAAANEAIIVTTPDPTAITDAYAMIKAMRAREVRPDLRLFVNMVHSPSEAQMVASRIRRVTKRFLGLEPQAVGYLVSDHTVSDCARAQRAFVTAYPESPAGRAVYALAARLSSHNRPGPFERGLGSMFERVSELQMADTKYDGDA